MESWGTVVRLRNVEQDREKWQQGQFIASRDEGETFRINFLGCQRWHLRHVPSLIHAVVHRAFLGKTRHDSSGHMLIMKQLQLLVHSCVAKRTPS